MPLIMMVTVYSGAGAKKCSRLKNVKAMCSFIELSKKEQLRHSIKTGVLRYLQIGYASLVTFFI